MNLHREKPSLVIKKGSELSLSGESIIALLKAVLNKGRPFRFKLKGISMSPFLRDGDIITVHPLCGKLPLRGDIVAFAHPLTKKLAIHRIILKKGAKFSLKGDNNIVEDGFLPQKDILGCVRKVEREGKKVRLGLGPEKFIIAILSHRNVFPNLFRPIRKLFRPVIKRGNVE